MKRNEKPAHYISVKPTGMCDARHIRQFPESICVETAINALITSRDNRFTKRMKIERSSILPEISYFFYGVCGIAWATAILCLFLYSTLQTLVNISITVGIGACICGTASAIIEYIVTCLAQFDRGYQDYNRGYNEVLIIAGITDWYSTNWYECCTLNSKIRIYCDDLYLLGMYDAMRLIPKRSPEMLIATLDKLAFDDDKITKRHLRRASFASYTYVTGQSLDTHTLASYYFKVLEDQHNASARN